MLRKRTVKVTVVVKNDIRSMHGSLTRLVPIWRLKAIIRDSIEEWRDLSVTRIKAKKVRR